MKAWQFTTHGDPARVLRLVDLPEPQPGPDEVLIQVSATSVNFADDLIVRGSYQRPVSLPSVPGMEVAGTVVGTAQRVVAMTTDLQGGYAGYAVARRSDVFPAPACLTDTEAAAFLVSYQTSWFALHRRASVQPGEFVLVHAAAGAVGSAAVQIARAAGARVIGVVGSPEKASVAAAAGCEEVLDRNHVDVAEAVRRLTDGHGADVVVDPVGGPSYESATRCVAWEGRIVVVGFTSGVMPRARAEHVMVKNYGVLGLHWGAYRDQDPQLVAAAHDTLCALADQGRLRPVVSAALPLDRAPEGLRLVASGRSHGRVVLSHAADR